jgi:hypothetical protein
MGLVLVMEFFGEKGDGVSDVLVLAAMPESRNALTRLRLVHLRSTDETTGGSVPVEKWWQTHGEMRAVKIIIWADGARVAISVSQLK